MSVRDYYTVHEELRKLRKDPVSLPIEKKKQDIHSRYFTHYMNPHVDYIKHLIIDAISHNETSCVIYNENTRDTGLDANDLVAIFSLGVADASSLESLFLERLDRRDYTIRCHRTVHSKLMGDTTVIVQFVLEWIKPSNQ